MNMAFAAAPDSRRRMLGKIHILIKQLGLDDTAYRALLREEPFNVASSAELGNDGLIRLIDHLMHGPTPPCPPRRRGVPKAGGAARPLPAGHRPGLATLGQLKKIRALWFDLKGWWTEDFQSSLDGQVKRMTGKARLEWITVEEAAVIIDGLKPIVARWQETKRDSLPPAPLDGGGCRRRGES